MSMRVVPGATPAAQQVALRQYMSVFGRNGFGLRVLPMLRQRSLLSLRGRRQRRWRRQQYGRRDHDELRG